MTSFLPADDFKVQNLQNSVISGDSAEDRNEPEHGMKLLCCGSFHCHFPNIIKALVDLMIDAVEHLFWHSVLAGALSG